MIMLWKSKGYWYTNKNGKVQSYSRYMLEQKLGRKLLSTEDAHHIDKNIDNNHPSNLEAKSSILHDLEHKLFSTRTTATKLKISNTLKGRKFSPETLERMSIAAKLRDVQRQKTRKEINLRIQMRKQS